MYSAGSLDDLSGAQRFHHTQNRLQAAWRLRPIVENDCIEETDIRLPPLQPGECFEDRYEASFSATVLVDNNW